MRILTVCLGNICRSPYAAAVLDARSGAGVEVRSAGLVGKWAGRPAHPLMVEAAEASGYDLTHHRAVQVSAELLRWADAILALDSAVQGRLRVHGGLIGATAKITLYLGDADVRDPYGGDRAAFAECALTIEAAAHRHLPYAAG
ncbi:low molecular weight phosphotyrosine protein phosphatase [Streptomyces sp. NPDC102360]|uniref:arsenate reductase/protein-tyrosine-phosphatase family protein n=1 Tax=Streptomyces sp. NPDC102360 TaxID=3366160 RepID=UPI0037F4CAF9